MLDHGNGQLSAVGFYNSGLGESPVGEFFGGVSARSAMAFDIDGNKVVHCALVFGRTLVSCSDTVLQALADGVAPAGIIYAKVGHNGRTRGVVLSVHASSGGELPPNELEASYRLLYKAGGNPPAWEDYRYMPTLFAMN